MKYVTLVEIGLFVCALTASVSWSESKSGDYLDPGAVGGDSRVHGWIHARAPSSTPRCRTNQLVGGATYAHQGAARVTLRSNNVRRFVMFSQSYEKLLKPDLLIEHATDFQIFARLQERSRRVRLCVSV